ENDADAREEEFTTWMAACDDALAAGTPAPAATPPDPVRARDDLACAQLLREVLGEFPTLSPDFGARGEVGEAPFPAAPAPIAAGALPWQTLGRFQLQSELGRGGCGVVYLAYDPLLNREVALKVPHAEMALSAQARERFHREARAASALDHPNIV